MHFVQLIKIDCCDKKYDVLVKLLVHRMQLPKT